MNSEITIDKSAERAKAAIANTFVLTDDNVAGLYGDVLECARHVCVIKHGEDSKTLKNAEYVLGEMAKAGLDRKSRLTAVGGGVVGDLGGFCAAVYMRGISWTNVPTTLLAQLDSSIGGKTGVDLEGYKNMVGAFHLPSDIFICTDFLKTLPEREILCGLGEAFKSALLDGKVKEQWAALPETVNAETDFGGIVSACARFKQRIVEADFREGSLRKILNLGHTVGHALEYLDNHVLSHGEYVAVGLAAEAHLGLSLGKSGKSDFEYIESEAAKLSPNYKRLKSEFSGERIAAAAKADKKNSSGKISVIIARDFNTEELFLSADELAKEIDKWKSDL